MLLGRSFIRGRPIRLFWRRHRHVLSHGANSVVAFIERASDFYDASWRERVCDLHVNLIPENHLQCAGQIFDPYDGERLALSPRKFFVDLHKCSGDFE